MVTREKFRKTWAAKKNKPRAKIGVPGSCDECIIALFCGVTDVDTCGLYRVGRLEYKLPRWAMRIGVAFDNLSSDREILGFTQYTKNLPADFIKRLDAV